MSAIRRWWYFAYRSTSGVIDWQEVEILQWAAQPIVRALEPCPGPNNALPVGQPVIVALDLLYDDLAKAALSTPPSPESPA